METVETGCKRWKDCFTCPLSECEWGDAQEIRELSYYKEYAEKHREQIREYKRQYYRDHKEHIRENARKREAARRAAKKKMPRKNKPSIIHTENKELCYICGQYATQTHHCWHGTANRKLADEDGLTVNLCERCHRALHDKGNFDRELQRIAQTKWMEYYEKSEADFRERYGKSRL